MRTNVVIDDKLMFRAMRSSGCRTKRSAIEQGRQLIHVDSDFDLMAKHIGLGIIWPQPMRLGDGWKPRVDAGVQPQADDTKCKH